MTKKDKYELYGFVSKTTLDVLKDMVAEPASSLAYILCLHLCIIKAHSLSVADNILMIRNFIVWNDNKTNSINWEHDDIDSLFDSNREDLLYMYHQIWFSKRYSKDLKWLKEWESKCRNILIKESPSKGGIFLLNVLKESLEGSVYFSTSLSLLHQLFNYLEMEQV